MPFIDHRGRLFGRWNLIDATVLGAVGVVSALGYGAFLLFQTPDPTIGSITPAEVVAGQPGTLRVAGTRLRSFLSVRLECAEADTAGCESLTVPLLVVGPTHAEVNVRNLTPGFYDFVLLDEARELVRVPTAVRVLPAAAMSALTMDVQALGAFVFVTDTDASLIVPGAILDEEPSPDRLRPLTSVVTIVKVSSAEASIQRLRIADAKTADATTLVPNRFEVPAIVTMRCTITADHRCRISGTNLFEDTLVPLALSVPEDQKFTRPVTHLAFRVDEVRPVTAPPEFPQRRVLPAAAMSALTMEVQAVGAFVFLSDTDASLIVPSAILDEEPSPDRLRPLTSVATIVKVSPAETSIQRLRIAAGNTPDATTLVSNRFEVPAIVTMRCAITADQRCRLSGTDLFKDTLVPLALAVPEDQKFTRLVKHLAFRVDEVRPVTAPREFPQRQPPPPIGIARVRVKILARAETAGLPRVGDEDFSVPVAADVAAQASAGRTLRASVVAVDAEPKQLPATLRIGEFEYQEPMTTFEVTFDVPVSLMPNGWMYADRRPIKVGGSFTFEGPTYVITGWIVDVRVARSTPSALNTR